MVYHVRECIALQIFTFLLLYFSKIEMAHAPDLLQCLKIYDNFHGFVKTSEIFFKVFSTHDIV